MVSLSYKMVLLWLSSSFSFLLSLELTDIRWLCLAGLL